LKLVTRRMASNRVRTVIVLVWREMHLLVDASS